MKSNALLVTNIGNGLSTVVAEAARRTGRGLKEANSTRRTFEILKLDLDDVDIAVVEIDATLHSLAILEALRYGPTAPPVIALMDVDDTEATHIVQQHGAAACLKKPFGPEDLARLIDKVNASACQRSFLACDKWGHVYGRKVRRSTPELDSKASRAVHNSINNAPESSSSAETTILFGESNEAGPPQGRERRETQSFLPSHDRTVPANRDNGGGAISQRAAAANSQE